MATYETTCLADALQPGDEITGTGIGGYEGKVESVRVYPDKVAVRFENGVCVDLFSFEVCGVLREERPRLATVHPIFDAWAQLARNAGR